jgi:hypothetical protein
MAKFPFTDLHGFKDYVGFVKLCAPDLFPARQGVQPDEQWTLELAFVGLREGLRLSAEEKGPLGIFSECAALIEEAFDAYSVNHVRDGYLKLDAAYNLLKKVPTR